ncbi:uncharacterized protein TRIVIDRAFT_60713 [Trichoderma virens Gv29-8]|uniref:Protein kinase domain-containing protein n=1 Tax=Hypocrea virens (strain Gv29-8 / FGSC 10586) TaxID=413071 RepID=G9MTS6_HYPVG|nr:uncharacterized protein TRIVIDRAFT_60713 [Trichoderma virens Gv29-8]EHK22425.1 hypothetical protein TRIVIDRAFT_60713 [Trichoderma virens Gv29-8]
MPETKTTRPAAGDQWTKRLKLNHSAAAISLAQPAPKSAAQLSTASTETTHAESCHLLSFASAREIVDKASVPILDLTDRETAIIQVTHTVSVDVSDPISATNTAAAYQLQRIKRLGATLSTRVFKCRHSAIPKPVVAKVLRYKGDSASKLARFAEVWKREKLVLENLKHQYIVSLQAFDGRMFASYLELLQGSGGTPWYLPPEIMKMKIRSPPGDTWALGVTILYVLGKIKFLEGRGRGWPIQKLTTPGEPQIQMNKWMDIATCRRAELNKVDKADQRQKIECRISKMFEIKRVLRIQAGSTCDYILLLRTSGK